MPACVSQALMNSGNFLKNENKAKQTRMAANGVMTGDNVSNYAPINSAEQQKINNLMNELGV